MNMTATTSKFMNASKRIDVSLHATAGNNEMRSNSTEHKIEKLMSKPVQSSKASQYLGSNVPMVPNKIDSKLAHASMK